MCVLHRCGVESEKVFSGEEHDTGGVKTEQFHFVSLATRRITIGPRNDATRNRLYDVSHDGYGDEEAGDVIKDERRSARLRVFKSAPHLLADGGRWMTVNLVDILQSKRKQITRGDTKSGSGAHRAMHSTALALSDTAFKYM